MLTRSTISLAVRQRRRSYLFRSISQSHLLIILLFPPLLFRKWRQGKYLHLTNSMRDSVQLTRFSGHWRLAQPRNCQSVCHGSLWSTFVLLVRSSVPEIVHQVSTFCWCSAAVSAHDRSHRTRDIALFGWPSDRGKSHDRRWFHIGCLLCETVVRTTCSTLYITKGSWAFLFFALLCRSNLLACRLLPRHIGFSHNP